jgi:hypothetical protein
MHRNIKQRLFWIHPDLGTRLDCMARSSALHINSTRQGNGLTEAVTCDIYSLGPRRSEECVCFPVYDHLVAEKTTVIDNVYTTLTTTSVFYPPVQVVESCLLAAASQGPPTICNHLSFDCPTSGKIISRDVTASDGFPYCPTPGRQARQHLPPRTLDPWRSTTTSTKG